MNEQPNAAQLPPVELQPDVIAAVAVPVEAVGPVPMRMPDAPRRSRAFVFTWNNYPAGYREVLDAIPVRYIVAGEEIAPNTGTPHLQGYVYFANARTEGAVRRLFPGCHVEVARGSHQQCDKYCRKTRPEDGEPNVVSVLQLTNC